MDILNSQRSNLVAVVVVVKGVEDLTFSGRTVLTATRVFFDDGMGNDDVAVANAPMNHVTQTTGKEWQGAQTLHIRLVVGADVAAAAVANAVGVDGTE